MRLGFKAFGQVQRCSTTMIVLACAGVQEERRRRVLARVWCRAPMCGGCGTDAEPKHAEGARAATAATTGSSRLRVAPAACTLRRWGRSEQRQGVVGEKRSK